MIDQRVWAVAHHETIRTLKTKKRGADRSRTGE